MLNKIQTIDFKEKGADKLFVQSLHDTGFAIIHNHTINTNKIINIYKEWNLFFANEDKYNYLFDHEKQDGYFPFKSENAKGSINKDLKEFYHFYLWGRHPNNITNDTQDIFYDLINLGKTLLDWIEINSPEKIKKLYTIPLSKMIENSNMNLLRIIHYPPIEDKKTYGSIRAAAHEDINLITLLSPGSESGLQVLNNKGEWIDIKSNPEWLVINTGDMLSECSNNYFPSTTHRVINPIGAASLKSRFTIPLFIHPRDEVILSKRYTASSFLNERLKEIGLKS